MKIQLIKSNLTPDSFLGEPDVLSSGSGFVVGQEGDSLLIVTNAHVVPGLHKPLETKSFTLRQDTQIRIVYFDRSQFDGAQIESVDFMNDLSILKARKPEGRFPDALSLRDLRTMRLGETAFAIGYPGSLGEGVTINRGIISGRGRFAMERFATTSTVPLLLTDTPLNHGNSGGPLFDAEGRVLGINDQIRERMQSVGFAIPASLLQKLLPRYLSHGEQVFRDWGYLDLNVEVQAPSGRLLFKTSPYQDLKEAMASLKLFESVYSKTVIMIVTEEVASNDPSQLHPGDLILEINGESVKSIEELSILAVSLSPGTTVQMKVQRGEELISLDRRVLPLIDYMNDVVAFSSELHKKYSPAPATKVIPNEGGDPIHRTMLGLLNPDDIEGIRQNGVRLMLTENLYSGF